jgi:hypothetical protein
MHRRGPGRGRLLLARSGGDGFSGEEADLARGMGRVLALTVSMLRSLAEAERRAVEIAHLNGLMEERQQLLERLSRIQRSISTPVPLDQVLESTPTTPPRSSWPPPPAWTTSCSGPSAAARRTAGSGGRRSSRTGWS